MRVYLTGKVAIEGGERIITESEFPGRQGRLLFAYLVCADGRPVPRDTIAELLWPTAPPAAPDAGIAAIVSKLRSLLARAQVTTMASIESGLGFYQLRLSPESWIDLSYAAQLVEQAESAARHGDSERAWDAAFLAAVILRRPFLPDERIPWVEKRREEMRTDLVRALEFLCDGWLARREHVQAALTASELVDLEPFRETAYQRLMRAHAIAGNRAEALRVYDRCRRLLSDELGVDPSPPTEAVYLEILRA
ncbi:MAG: AfsR/SARP family transcriptional regulator [Candidatus Limnocylindria bacterium]